MGEIEFRRQQREEMYRNAKAFAEKMGRNPTEVEIRTATDKICDRVEKRKDRNIKDQKSE